MTAPTERLLMIAIIGEAAAALQSAGAALSACAAVLQQSEPAPPMPEVIAAPAPLDPTPRVDPLRPVDGATFHTMGRRAERPLDGPATDGA